MFDAAVFNVVKRGLCGSEKESIPIGNGDIGANVWADRDGCIRILISKTDALSEAGNILKIGLVRLRFSAPVFTEEEPETHLDLRDGTVTVRNRLARVQIAAFRGKGLLAARFVTDGDARMDAESVIWRTEPKNAGRVAESPDVRVDASTWYHANETSEFAYEKADGRSRELNDYIKNRCFAASFETAPAENGCTVYIAVECGTTYDPKSMVRSVKNAARKAAREDAFERYREENETFWKEYFGKYYVKLGGTEDARDVCRLYTLQKYMNGCADRGVFPIKFNGSIFCCGSKDGTETDYDFRNWGGCYWIQNTRLIYWNMLYTGDFEGMKVLFDFLYERLPAFRENAWLRYRIDGALVPETMTIHGTYPGLDYGAWQRQAAENGPAEPQCSPWTIDHFNGMLELSYMMLCFLSYAGDGERAYFDRVCYPFIHDVLVFFRERFPAVGGKMRFDNVSSLETWWHCDNDTPDIAGLTAILCELDRLGLDTVIDPDVLPDLPRETRNGKEVIAACEVYREESKNCENPELYAVFPYFLYDGAEGLCRLIQDTYDERHHKFNNGWSQDLIQAALLQRTEKCVGELPPNFRRKADGYFFDAMFGPNMDWIPDQCHGSSNSIALRMMLLQDKRDKVRVKPCVPENWECAFRLPAHNGRTVAEE